MLFHGEHFLMHGGRLLGTVSGPGFVGFFVLTLGEARPLKNVGGLTAAAMIVAAAVTFLVIPVLARRRFYALAPEPEDPADVYA